MVPGITVTPVVSCQTARIICPYDIFRLTESQPPRHGMFMPWKPDMDTQYMRVLVTRSPTKLEHETEALGFPKIGNPYLPDDEPATAEL